MQPWESAGGWRKDEFQWMSSTLVGDSKGIWPQVVEQGLTSHQTHYRSYRGRFLRVRWPNQQCQALKDNSWSVHCSDEAKWRLRPQNLCSNYPSWNVLFLYHYSSSFNTVTSPVWIGHNGWDRVKQDVWRVKGNMFTWKDSHETNAKGSAAEPSFKCHDCPWP